LIFKIEKRVPTLNSTLLGVYQMISNKEKMPSSNKNQSKTRLVNSTIVIPVLVAAVVIGIAIAPTTGVSLISASAAITIPSSDPPSLQQQNNVSMAKPVDGYNTPQGHLSAIRHIFDDPSLRVHHYCKPNDKIVIVCQLYDSDKPNATLIGVEYIITKDQYNSLPNREKPNWHAHKIEFAVNRADPMLPELPAAQAQAVSHKLMDTYGKVIITWNPKDTLPVFPPQVEQVQHPFMVNATITPYPHGGFPSHGSFNQTLKY
jgi:Protein of unknown function (DUF1264)